MQHTPVSSRQPLIGSILPAQSPLDNETREGYRFVGPLGGSPVFRSRCYLWGIPPVLAKVIGDAVEPAGFRTSAAPGPATGRGRL